MTKNELNLFDFNGHDIRVIDQDGKAWFPAKDVCDVLGLSNPTMAVKQNCEPEDIQILKRSNLTASEVADFPTRGMNCVSETGFYELVFASRRPEARDFRRWVAKVVLPAIQRDGMYVRGEEDVQTDEDLIKLAHDTMGRLRNKLEETTKELGIMSERVAETQRTVAHVAGQIEGVNRNKIKSDLLREGYLHRAHGQYRVRAKYRDVLFGERLSKHGGAMRCNIMVLPDGEKLIAQMKREGKLTLKAGWS